MDPKMKHAMEMVMGRMGAAAREGKMRRYQPKPKSVDVTMGEVTLEPTKEHEMMGGGAKSDEMVDPLHNSISPDELDEMMGGLQH